MMTIVLTYVFEVYPRGYTSSNIYLATFIHKKVEFLCGYQKNCYSALSMQFENLLFKGNRGSNSKWTKNTDLEKLA